MTELTEKWARAELDGDVDTLRELLTDDFIGVGPLGFTLTKDQWLQRYLSGSLKYTSYTLADLRPRVYGDAAVVIGVATQDGTFEGRSISGRFRATHIFASQGGTWRAAGWHASPMGPMAFPGGPSGPGGQRPGPQ